MAVHTSSVVDGVGGVLARLTGLSSSLGAVFPAVLDRGAGAVIKRGYGVVGIPA